METEQTKRRKNSKNIFCRENLSHEVVVVEVGCDKTILSVKKYFLAGLYQALYQCVHPKVCKMVFVTAGVNFRFILTINLETHLLL